MRICWSSSNMVLVQLSSAELCPLDLCIWSQKIFNESHILASLPLQGFVSLRHISSSYWVTIHALHFATIGLKCRSLSIACPHSDQKRTARGSYSMNFTISILDINIDQSQQSFLHTVGVFAKTAVSEGFLAHRSRRLE